MSNEEREMKNIIKTIAATLASVNQFNRENFIKMLRNLYIASSVQTNEYGQSELHFIDFQTLNATREWFYVLGCQCEESRGNGCFILTL